MLRVFLHENTQTETCSQTPLHNFTYVHTNAVVIAELYLILILLAILLVGDKVLQFAETCNFICLVSRDLRGVKIIYIKISALLTAEVYRNSYFNSSFKTGKPTCQIFHHFSDLTVFTTPYLCLVFNSVASLFSALHFHVFVFILPRTLLPKQICLFLTSYLISASKMNPKQTSRLIQ